MSPETQSFSLSLEQLSGYEFRVRFDGITADDLVLDEPEPLGHGAGPNASRILAAAVANCLSASLLFCLAKSHIETNSLRTKVTGHTRRNQDGRVRIEKLDVQISLGAEMPDVAHLRRCLDLFENYCVVTESVRQGIPVNVQVVDEHGETVHQSD